MVLTKQLDAVQSRLGASYRQEFPQQVFFCASDNTCLAKHNFKEFEGSQRIEGLPQWQTDLFDEDLGHLWDLPVRRITRASEHSVFLRFGPLKVEVWPMIRRYRDMPADSDNFRDGLRNLGYHAFDATGQKVYWGRCEKIGEPWAGMSPSAPVTGHLELLTKPVVVCTQKHVAAAPCSDCGGTGLYTGLLYTEPCKTCRSV